MRYGTCLEGLPRPPSLLSLRVLERSARTRLVENAGNSQRRPPRLPCAFLAAVSVAAVTTGADPGLRSAALTKKQTVRRFRPHGMGGAFTSHPPEVKISQRVMRLAAELPRSSKTQWGAPRRLWPGRAFLSPQGRPVSRPTPLGSTPGSHQAPLD